jgi:formylglycine-generating enzyme required for sulfatase activity
MQLPFVGGYSRLGKGCAVLLCSLPLLLFNLTRNKRKLPMIRILALVVLLLAFPAQAVVTIDWVTVGDAGNSCDTQTEGCFGAVADEYRISKYETTNAQFADFLNAVAATDTYGLYTMSMGGGYGGITRNGSSGIYTYTLRASRESMPVNYVSLWSALRFANWLHNGQPTGMQDNSTTEDGAYTLDGYTGIDGGWIRRNAGATIFVTSENEWYKAAYYKGGGTSAGYWDYPAGSDTQTTCTTPGVTANTANCNWAVGDLTDGGSYTGSASPYGTFDQGGNVWEMNEAIIGSSTRGIRGGDYLPNGSMIGLPASFRFGLVPDNGADYTGFRVASPSPASPPVPSLSTLGIATLCSLLGLAGLRRLRG